MTTDPRGAHRPRGASAVIVFSLLLSGLVVASRPARPAGESLLITGVRILDTRSGRYQATAGVLVQDGRIAALHREAPQEWPAEARRIDLPGTTMVPGLGDLHATATPTSAADADFYYLLALAHGVTFCRGVDMTLPWAARQRDRIRTGDILAPRLWVSGPGLDQQAAFSFSLRRVADVTAAKREVAAQAQAGADWIRVHSNTGPEVLRAILSAALTSKVRTSAEPGVTSAAELVRLGVGVIDRLGYLAHNRTETEASLSSLPDYPRGDTDAASDYAWEHLPEADVKAAAALMPRRRTIVVPLLASFRGVLRAKALESDPALSCLPARVRDAMMARAYPDEGPETARAARAAGARSRAVAALAKAGVRLATGADTESRGYAVPGAGIHKELSLLVQSGLTPAEAIRAATINAAEALGAGTSLGQITVGSDADFFIVEGDPLRQIEDLQRIKLIVRGGEALNRDELLQQAKRATR